MRSGSLLNGDHDSPMHARFMHGSRTALIGLAEMQVEGRCMEAAETRWNIESQLNTSWAMWAPVKSGGRHKHITAGLPQR
jgi:hypothetical protein